MPTKRKSDTPSTGFKSKYTGVDLMAGPEIRTTPTCPPKMLQKMPQLGLNMGMDIRRP